MYLGWSTTARVELSFWIIAMFQTCPRGVKRQLSTLVVIMELLTLSKRMPQHVKDITELHKLGKWMGFSQLQVEQKSLKSFKSCLKLSGTGAPFERPQDSPT